VRRSSTVSKRRLGKGIDALLQGRDLEQLSNMASILMISIENVTPNPDQPRKSFSDDSLQELADSIADKGIIQPILAEDRGDGTYIIIAGERRYRAAKLAGLDEVPIISHEFSDDEKLEIALIENIQREDLNPVDEARAIKQIVEHSDGTQEEVAKRLGKSRSAVSNAIRMLNLEPDILEALASGSLSAGHARALLHVDDADKRLEYFHRSTTEGLSVRQLEALVNGRPLPTSSNKDAEAEDERTSIGDPGDTVLEQVGGETRSGSPGEPTKSVELRRFEELLISHFGTKVIIKGNDRHGRVEFEYHSTDDLERLLEAMQVDISQA
jgi:ParB family chromosome partitioning protein